LHTHRARLSSAPGRLIFPSRRDPNRPVTRHLAADWLKRAYRITGIEKEPGSLRHAFRRKWGHDRQDDPTLETMYVCRWVERLRDVSAMLPVSRQCDHASARGLGADSRKTYTETYAHRLARTQGVIPRPIGRRRLPSAHGFGHVPWRSARRGPRCGGARERAFVCRRRV
jgi:integrase